MRKIKIPLKYKKIIFIFKWCALITSIVFSFFTFSTFTALLLSLLLVVIGIFVEKIIFKYNFLYVNPVPPPMYLETNQSSICIGFDEIRGIERPFIGLVFNTKEVARQVHIYFRALINNKYNDISNEIIVSYVFEDEKRYTLFIYPSINRNKTLENIDKVKLEQGHNISKVVEFNVMSVFKYWPSTFSGEGNLKEILRNEVLSKTPFALQTLYFDNGEVHVAQKRPIFKYDLRISDREDLNSQDIEYGFQWHK